MKTTKRISICVLIGMLFLTMCQPVAAGGGKVNINTATKAELVELKYIGEKTAEKIIQYRKAHPFEKASDIINVKGIGEKVLNANKDKITVKDK